MVRNFIRVGGYFCGRLIGFQIKLKLSCQKYCTQSAGSEGLPVKWWEGLGMFVGSIFSFVFVSRVLKVYLCNLFSGTQIALAGLGSGFRGILNTWCRSGSKTPKPSLTFKPPGPEHLGLGGFA